MQPSIRGIVMNRQIKDSLKFLGIMAVVLVGAAVIIHFNDQIRDSFWSGVITLAVAALGIGLFAAIFTIVFVIPPLLRRIAEQLERS